MDPIYTRLPMLTVKSDVGGSDTGNVGGFLLKQLNWDSTVHYQTSVHPQRRDRMPIDRMGVCAAVTKPLGVELETKR